MQEALGLVGEQKLMFSIMVALGVAGILALFLALFWPKRLKLPYNAEVIVGVVIAALGIFGALNSQATVAKYQADIPHIEQMSGKAEIGADASAFDRAVSVYSYQWGFIFIESDGRATRNALVAKPGERILVHVLANDVIHGFQIPAARLTTEVDPKAVRSVWFRAPKEPGKYLIQCIDYCGIGHHQMKAWLVVRQATGDGRGDGDEHRGAQGGHG